MKDEIFREHMPSAYIKNEIFGFVLEGWIFFTNEFSEGAKCG